MVIVVVVVTQQQQQTTTYYYHCSLSLSFVTTTTITGRRSPVIYIQGERTSTIPLYQRYPFYLVTTFLYFDLYNSSYFFTYITSPSIYEGRCETTTVHPSFFTLCKERINQMYESSVPFDKRGENRPIITLYVFYFFT